MTKSYRHGQILRLIRAAAVHTQEELARALRADGVNATQVTLSRDIRELGLIKTPSGYREGGKIEPVPASQLEGLAAEFLREVKVAQNLVVLRTAPGHANSVAVALDQANWTEVVGTIAGDDTILVVAPDSQTATTLRQKFLSLLEF